VIEVSKDLKTQQASSWALSAFKLLPGDGFDTPTGFQALALPRRKLWNPPFATSRMDTWRDCTIEWRRVAVRLYVAALLAERADLLELEPNAQAMQQVIQWAANPSFAIKMIDTTLAAENDQRKAARGRGVSARGRSDGGRTRAQSQPSQRR
jgi:hypothetical protein